MEKVSAFKDFININSGTYFIPPNTPAPQEETPQQVSEYSTQNKTKKDFFRTPKGAAFLGLLGMGYLFFKGSSTRYGRNLTQKFSKTIEYFEDKIDAIKSKRVENAITFIERVYFATIRGAKKVAEKSKIATNIIPVRDIYCEKIMNCLKIKNFTFGKFLCDYPRTVFENMTRMAHLSVFNKTSSQISKELNNFSEIINSALKKAAPEEAKVLENIQNNLFAQIYQKHQNFFGLSAFKTRLNSFIDEISSLPQKAEEEIKRRRTKKEERRKRS